MTSVPALEDLIGTAVRDGATALHLHLEGSSVAAMARQGRALAPLGRFEVTVPWLDGAHAHPGATRMNDRIVIRIDAHGVVRDALAGLGMPGKMRTQLHAALGRSGGAVLAVGTSAISRRTLAQALAAPAGYAPWIAGERHALEAAAQMDCDAILIDVLADGATAALALDLARAGQRVVIAIDAISAVAAIEQLRTLKVERHLLGAALQAAIAAHASPRLCPVCRLPAQAQTSESALLGIDPGTVIYRAAGCGACDGMGYAGTALVFEAIVVDGPFHGLLAKGADTALLARHAFLAAPTLAASARTLAREGAITADEAIRIARAGAGNSAVGTNHPHILTAAGNKRGVA
ncbi:ATPase, T2SS/T4P/T4SS family [Sphingomonas koreensis]